MTPTASAKAFTLIEVMMAATILVVSFSAVIMAVSRGAEMIDIARKQQIAQQIIEGEIGGTRLRPWSSVPPGEGDISYPVGTATITLSIDSAGDAVGSAEEKKSFALTNFTDDSMGADDNISLLNTAKGFTISRISSDIRTGYRKITYEVSWPGRAGKTYSQRGVAYFGQNGLQLSYQK
jgi:prepilin-type N-terminal cleavage/methylation domain-containing protein